MAKVKLTELMKEKQLLSFEVFPPKTDKGMENLPGTIEKLCEFNPEYISCTYGAGGGNVGRNREVCQEIIKAGTTPVTHFTVIKNTKEGIKQQHCAAIFRLARPRPVVILITQPIWWHLHVKSSATSSRSQ